MSAPTTARTGAAAPALANWNVPLMVLGLAVLAYAPVLSRLIRVWFTDEDMAHGIFAPLVGGYDVWSRRRELGRLKPGMFPAGLWICAAAALLRIAGTLAQEVLLGRIALVVTLIGLLYLFFGRPAVRSLLFPLLLLVCAIPIPKMVYTYATFHLQMLSSVLAERILDALGYTILREGTILELVGQKLAVAEACSGIRSLISLSFLTAVYLYFHHEWSPLQWAVMAAAIPSAMLANALRIVVTAVIGERDPVFALGIFHALSGWVLTLAAFVFIMALHAVLIRGREARWRLTPQ